MIRHYAERGLLAGAAGGLAFGLYVAVVGNPLVHAAETLAEGGHDHASHAHGGEASVVSEATTNLVSVGGGVLWGLLLGAVVFGVVYYLFEPAIPGEGATKRYVLAAAGFLTVSGAPWLVVPPRPPGVESTVPVFDQQLLYGAMVLAGAVVCILAGLVYRRLTDAGVRRSFTVVGALSPLVLLAIPPMLVSVPTTGSVPEAVLRAYRGSVVFGQTLLWFVLASAHMWLGEPDASEQMADLAVDDPAYPSD